MPAICGVTIIFKSFLFKILSKDLATSSLTFNKEIVKSERFTPKLIGCSKL